MIVLDASAALELLLRAATHQGLVQRLLESGGLLAAPHLLHRIWQLRHNCTAYDAAYLALAEELGCPLITCDKPLAAVPGHRATIELFAE